MNCKRTLGLIACLLLALHGVSAADGPVYYVRDIRYEVQGNVRHFAIRAAAELKLGEEIRGDEALAKFLADKTQLLLNQRTLDDAGLSYSAGQADADGRIPLDLVVAVTTTWNVIALPYGKYDSNSGLELSIKARDYNFLGTMQPLRIDFGYEIDDKGFQDKAFSEGAYFVEFDSDTPFDALGYTWNFNFDHAFSYTHGEPLYYKNTTGVSMDIPFGFTTLTVGAFQKTVVNEENKKSHKALYGDYFSDVWYTASGAEAKWKIPTGIRVDGFGELTYVPRVSAEIKYRPYGEIDEPRKGPEANLGQSLNFGRINWMGNYRKGLAATVGNDNVYNFHTETWDRTLTAGVTGHLPLLPFFGVSARAMAMHRLDKTDTSAAEPLRGILNDQVDADSALYLNVDFPVRVIRFVPSQWFKTRKLRLFDFEQHWSPFFDAALVEHGDGDRSFSLSDAVYSGGLEVITFPLFMRSLYIRISVGWDGNYAMEYRRLPGGGFREIFIGLGHHY